MIEQFSLNDSNVINKSKDYLISSLDLIEIKELISKFSKAF